MGWGSLSERLASLVADVKEVEEKEKRADEVLKQDDTIADLREDLAKALKERDEARIAAGLVMDGKRTSANHVIYEVGEDVQTPGVGYDQNTGPRGLGVVMEMPQPDGTHLVVVKTLAGKHWSGQGHTQSHPGRYMLWHIKPFPKDQQGNDPKVLRGDATVLGEWDVRVLTPHQKRTKEREQAFKERQDKGRFDREGYQD